MLEARLQHHFSVTADALYQSVGALAPAAEQATQLLLTALTNGAKVWVAGTGAGHVPASALVAGLWHGLGASRPALAAVLLSQGVTQAPGMAQQWVTPVSALGQPGDVLWLWPGPERDTADEGTWGPLAEAARARELTVVWASPHSGGPVPNGVKEGDLWLPVPRMPVAAWMTQAVALATAVCDGVDAMLLGDGPEWME